MKPSTRGCSTLNLHPCFEEVKSATQQAGQISKASKGSETHSTSKSRSSIHVKNRQSVEAYQVERNDGHYTDRLVYKVAVPKAPREDSGLLFCTQSILMRVQEMQEQQNKLSFRFPRPRAHES